MAEKNLEFSRRLCLAIRATGLKQKEVAARLGVQPNSVTAYCKHGGVPEWNILLPMARLLGVSVEWLLDGTGPAAAEERPADQESTRVMQCGPPATELRRDVNMAWAILESGTGEAEALRSNVHSFYKAAFGIEALKDQLGIDGLPSAYRQEYLTGGGNLKGGGRQVPMLSGETDQIDNGESNPGKPRRKIS